MGSRLHSAYRAAWNYVGHLAYGGSPHAASQRALYLFYDLEVAPITFDFAWTLVAADLRRRELHLDSLRVVIVPGPIAGGRQEPADYDTIFDAASRDWRLWNIVVEMCRSLSNPCSVLVCNTRAEAEQIFFSDAMHVFPEGYTPNSPVVVTNEAVKASSTRNGEDIMIFKAPLEARRYVAKWRERHCPGRKLVVVTLRQSPYMPDRNSDLTAWKSFVAGLDEAKYHVALIPDTDAVSEWTEEWPNTTVVTEACFNLQIRHAFYQCCYVGMGVNSGPLILTLLNPESAFAMFIKVRENVPQVASAYLERRGFVFAKTPEFCTPMQLWVWEDDCLEHLQRTFVDLVNAIDCDAAQARTEIAFADGGLR